MSPDSLEIDRRFDGVGRFKKRIGSTNPVVKRKYNRMLSDLKNDGRTDIIRAIKHDQLSFPEAYEAWVRRRLDTLPIGETAPMLSVRFQKWLDTLIVGDHAPADCSASHFSMLEQARRYFERENSSARVADLPELLERLRNKLGVKHPTAFNHARAAALTFVRSTLKRSHPLWIAIAAVERRKVRERDRRQGIALSVAQMEEFFPHRTTDPYHAVAWGIVSTGMGEKEYWGEWRVLVDRVRIGGTKRPHRLRDVPLVLAPPVPTMHPRTFTNWLRAHTNRFIQPYDLRRTYANWLVEAGIVRSRRKAYLGHAAGDISGLYERHEVDRYLREDAQKIRTLLALPPSDAPGLRVEKSHRRRA